MAEMTDEQKKERRNAEMSGLLNSKRGLTIFYTSIMCLDIEEAMEKVKLECELRGIPFDSNPTPPEPPKDIWGKLDTMMAKGSELTAKYPIVAEIGAPLIKTFIAGAGTAILGAITGAKIADNANSNEDYQIDESAPVMELGAEPQCAEEVDSDKKTIVQ